MKVLIWFLCSFVYGIITVTFQKNGIILGAIPTCILVGLSLWVPTVLCRKWDEHKGATSKSDETPKAITRKISVCAKCGYRGSDFNQCPKCGKTMIFYQYVTDIEESSKKEKDEIGFCRKCGEKLIDNSRFCRKCGTEIIEENQNDLQQM